MSVANGCSARRRVICAGSRSANGRGMYTLMACLVNGCCLRCGEQGARLIDAEIVTAIAEFAIHAHRALLGKDAFDLGAAEHLQCAGDPLPGAGASEARRACAECTYVVIA